MTRHLKASKSGQFLTFNKSRQFLTLALDSSFDSLCEGDPIRAQSGYGALICTGHFVASLWLLCGLSYEFTSTVRATHSKLGCESQVLAMARGASRKNFDDGRRRRVDMWERWRQEAHQGGVLTIAGGDKSAGGSSVPIWFFFSFLFFFLSVPFFFPSFF